MNGNEESAQVQKLRKLLDALPAPSVNVDLGRVYAETGRRRSLQVRRWRRAVVACAALAATVLLAMVLKLHLRFDANGVTLAWADPPTSKTEPVPPVNERVLVQNVAPPVTLEDMQLVKDLVRALAGRVDTLDARQRRAAMVLETRLAVLAADVERSHAADRETANTWRTRLEKGERR